MDTRHLTILTRHTLLIQEALDVPMLIGPLTKCGILTEQTVKDVQSDKTPSGQASKILSILKTKDAESFSKFISALQTNEHKDLAEILKEAENAQRTELSQEALTSKVDELFNTHAPVNRTFKSENKQSLVDLLIPKDYFATVKRLLHIEQEKTIKLNCKIYKLNRENASLNERVSELTKSKRDKEAEVDRMQRELTGLQKLTDDKNSEMQDLIQGLQKEKHLNHELSNTNYDEQLHNQDMEIMALQEKLAATEQKLASAIETLNNERKLKEIYLRELNKKLGIVVKAPSVHGSMGGCKEQEDHPLLLKINVDFVIKRILELEKQLNNSNFVIENLRKQESSCKELLGISVPESTLYDNLKMYLSSSSTDKSSLNRQISALSSKLENFEFERKALVAQINELQLDKQMLKTSFKLMRKRVLDTKFGTFLMNPENQQTATGYVTLPDIKLPSQYRLAKSLDRQRSQSDFCLLSLTQPPALNMTYRGRSAPERTNSESFDENEEPDDVTTNKDASKSVTILIDQDEATRLYMKCSTCAQQYCEDDNHELACSFHTKPYKALPPHNNQKRWQCCFKSSRNAVGCATGKHKPKQLVKKEKVSGESQQTTHD